MLAHLLCIHRSTFRQKVLFYRCGKLEQPGLSKPGKVGNIEVRPVGYYQLKSDFWTTPCEFERKLFKPPTSHRTTHPDYAKAHGEWTIA
jgi:hypothetical protein